MDKLCVRCRVSKSYPQSFFRDCRYKSGYRNVCKQCDQSVKRSPEAIARRQANATLKRKTGEYSYHCPRDKYKERDYRRLYLQNRRDNDPTYRAWKAQKDKEYRQTLKGKLRLFKARTKRRSYKDVEQITPEQWQQTLLAFNYSCAYCSTFENLTYDHFIPLKFGGRHIFGNIVPACNHCNSSKGDKMPDNWCTPKQLSCVLGILNNLRDAQPPAITEMGRVH